MGSQDEMHMEAAEIHHVATCFITDAFLLHQASKFWLKTFRLMEINAISD